MTEDEFVRFALGRSPSSEELARVQVIKSAARSSGIDPAIFPVLFGMREQTDRADLPTKIRDAAADAVEMVSRIIERGPTESERKEFARFRVDLAEVVRARQLSRRHERQQVGLAAAIVGAMFIFGVLCGSRIAVAEGMVNDEVYRLERLGAAWELYHSQLSSQDASRADRFMARHMIYLPNPR
jgi:hypothetical protein